MTSTIPEAEILREFEKDTRDAWEHYQDRLRELTGAEYERVEAESWDELQSELQRLDRRREDLKATAV
jgi:polyhydroxyalkanoate synthesis regulator phasin